MSSASPSRLDRIGACASAICAVHCVLTGAALGLLSVAGLTFLREPWVEAAFLLTTAILGGWSLRHGLRRHGSWIPSVFFLSGLAMIVAKHYVLGHEAGGGLGTALSVLGGLSLVTFFLLNARLPHKACGCFKGTRCEHPEASEVPEPGRWADAS